MAALRELGGLDGARVLEIGCGDGRLTFRYAPAARSVLAINPRAEGIAKARDMVPVELAERVASRSVAPSNSTSRRPASTSLSCTRCDDCLLRAS